MALRGDFVFKKFVQTDVDEEVQTVPEDLEESDPNYDKRGQEITVSRPIGHYEDDPEQTYIDHICAINSCGIHSERPTADNKIWNVAVIWAIYENEEDRLYGRNVVKQGEFTRHDGIDFAEVQSSTDVYEFCYNYMKENEEWVRNTTDI